MTLKDALTFAVNFVREDGETFQEAVKADPDLPDTLKLLYRSAQAQREQVVIELSSHLSELEIREKMETDSKQLTMFKED